MNKNQRPIEYTQEFRNLYHEEIKPILNSIAMLPKPIFTHKRIVIICICIGAIMTFMKIDMSLILITLIITTAITFFLATTDPTLLWELKEELINTMLPYILDNPKIIPTTKNTSLSVEEQFFEHKIPVAISAKYFGTIRGAAMAFVTIETVIIFAYFLLEKPLAIFEMIYSMSGENIFGAVLIGFLIFLTLLAGPLFPISMGKMYHDIPMLKQWNKLNYHSVAGIDDHFRGYYHDLEVNVQEMEFFMGDRALIISVPQIKKTNSTITVKHKKFNLTKNHEKPVTLEDQDFNKIYKVTADSQVDARYILTTAFMNRLKELNDKGIILSCCFSKNYVYIVVKTTRNLFEISDTNKIHEEDVFLRPIIELKEVLSIIDTLKLDENIGM